MSSNKKSTLCMTFGALLVVFGAVLVVYWPPLFLTQLQNQMVLTNTSKSFPLWRETPIDMYIKYYMFNITNINELLSHKENKIMVKQLGPYVYKQVNVKTNLTWYENSTVSFYNQRWWYFVPEMSNGSLSDLVTSINPTVVTTAHRLRGNNIALKLFVDSLMKTIREHMFITANVTSWLFDGIEDPMLDLVKNIPIIKNDLPFDKFAWFYNRNGSVTFDGMFLMNTGAIDFSMLGNTEKWQYSNQTVYRDECGAVKGSTGELWAQVIGQEEIYVFSSDLCTYIILGRNKEVTVDGIKGMQFAANNSVFDNGFRYPRMACYCDKNRANCLPPGALDVSSCRYGSPAAVTLPHMLFSDPYYPSKINGMNATEDYNFRMSLEAYTGIPLSVNAQIQLNFVVKHIKGFTLNNQLPDEDTMVPMFWFVQEVEMTPQYASLVKMVVNLRFGIPYGLYALTFVGVSLLMFGIYIMTRRLLITIEEPLMSSSSSDLNGTSDSS